MGKRSKQNKGGNPIPSLRGQQHWKLPGVAPALWQQMRQISQDVKVLSRDCKRLQNYSEMLNGHVDLLEGAVPSEENVRDFFAECAERFSRLLAGRLDLRAPIVSQTHGFVEDVLDLAATIQMRHQELEPRLLQLELALAQQAAEKAKAPRLASRGLQAK